MAATASEWTPRAVEGQGFVPDPLGDARCFLPKGTSDSSDIPECEARFRTDLASRPNVESLTPSIQQIARQGAAIKMDSKTRVLGLSCIAAWLLCLPAYAQRIAPQPLAFESASVKPAAPDDPTDGLAFMIALGRQVPPRGLLTMTAPLAPFIMFAYDVQDEVEARAMRARLPEWAQRQKYTIVARPPQDAPTIDQLRLMLRSLLEDRFALKAHRASHTGAVNALVVAKPGAAGPGLKLHPASRVCLERESTSMQKPLEPGEPTPLYCGLDLHTTAGGEFHVSMIDVTLPEACTLLGGLGGVLGGRGMEPVVDGTGLPGRWDITLDFLPERDGLNGDAKQLEGDRSGPTFTGALEKQLGLRLKKSYGIVEDLIVDFIAEATPD